MPWFIVVISELNRNGPLPEKMAMLKKKRQIKFYCNEDQFQALQLLKVTLNRTTQDMMTEAMLNWFMSADLPQGWSYMELWGRLNDQLTEVSNRNISENAPEWIKDLCKKDPAKGMRTTYQLAAREIWIRCIDELPDSTVLAFRQLMEDSLKFFSSSRLKAKKLQPSELEPEPDGAETR